MRAEPSRTLSALRERLRRQDGQSMIELLFLLPIYVLLMIFVLQFTLMFYDIFDDYSDVRNTALKQAEKAESLSIRCYEKKSIFSFRLGLTGPSQPYSTKVQIHSYGSGGSTCR